MNEMLFDSNRIYSYGTETNDDTVFNTLLFADEQSLFTYSEDAVRRAQH